MLMLDNKKYCVVVVEDDKDSLVYYETVLKANVKNCNIVSFDNINKDLFEFIHNTHIDLFIVDIHIGSEDGIALSKTFLETMTGLTFLFVSGYDYTIDSFKMFDGKCIYDYMSKPIKPEELIIRVKALLNISRSYTRVLQYIEMIKDECMILSTDNLRNEYLHRVHEDQMMINKIKDEVFK